MKRLRVYILTLLSMAIFILVSCERSNLTSPDVEMPGVNINNQYIIIFDDDAFGNVVLSQDAIQNKIQSIMNNYGINKNKLVYLYSSAVKGFCANLTPEQLEIIKSDKRVKLIEQDRIIKVDDIVDGQARKNKPPPADTSTPPPPSPPPETVSWGITFVGGYSEATTATKTAWIIDSGIDLDHPDLNVQVNLSKTFVLTGPDTASADDLNGHGSHVAGIVGARHNTIGVVGVCPNAKLVAVKVLNLNNTGTWSAIIAGINYVAANAVPGDVANISIGGNATTSVDLAVLNLASKGVFVTIAAGNQASNANNYSPARTNGQNIFTVSAHNSSNVFASFSNWSNPPIDWCAPGVSIYSTYKNGTYASMSGTSMSAPHVAGILLVTGGFIYSRGYVSGDPDGNPDLLAKWN